MKRVDQVFVSKVKEREKRKMKKRRGKKLNKIVIFFGKKTEEDEENEIYFICFTKSVRLKDFYKKEEDLVLTNLIQSICICGALKGG